MRISLLIDSPLSTLIKVLREFPTELKREIGKQTKKVAQPIWSESVHATATTRRGVRAADTARVGVTAENVFLRAGLGGKLSSGTGISQIILGEEFGADPKTEIKTTSVKGKRYKRRLGRNFRLPRRGGYIFYPASSAAFKRIFSLWVQTAYRTMHETIEKVT